VALISAPISQVAARAKALARLGIPDETRRQVWRLALGNQLNITDELFTALVEQANAIRRSADNKTIVPGSRADAHTKNMLVLETDLPRTFGQTGMFGVGGPNHQPMLDVLAAYDLFRPDIGYVCTWVYQLHITIESL
jgi:hypothetical protein